MKNSSASPEQTLSQVLNSLEEAGQHEHVSIAEIQEAVGSRSFGPLLLVAGLIQITPIGAVPGVPTVLGTFVALMSIQLVIGRKQFWMPAFIAKRTLSGEKLQTAVRWLLPLAKLIDNALKPRLTFLLSKPFMFALALLSCAFAVTMPPLEFVPFGGSVPAIAIIAFGLAMMFRDGLLAIAGVVFGIGALIMIGLTVA